MLAVTYIILFVIRTYLVSTPIIAYYYSELVGDARNPPTLLAAAGFSGSAVIGIQNFSYFVYYCLMFRSQMQILTEMAATTGMLQRIICTFFFHLWRDTLCLMYFSMTQLPFG